MFRKNELNENLQNILKNPVVSGIERDISGKVKIILKRDAEQYPEYFNDAKKSFIPFEKHDLRGPDRPIERNSEVSPERSIEPVVALKRTAVSIMAGFQVRNACGNTGTIGPLVIEKSTGREGFLTNWHVAKDSKCFLSDPFLYQGYAKNENPITIPSKSIINVSGDACFCPFISNVRNYDRLNRTWKERRLPIKKASMPILGETVYKTGRTTGYTRGFISAHAVIKIQYQTISNPVEIDCFKIIPLPEDGDIHISDGGDSGSGWYSIRNGEAHWVGLNFAGESSNFFPEAAYACYMPLVLNELGLEIL